MIVGFLLTTALLILLASVVVPAGSLGKFERQRRQGKADDLEVEREVHYSDVVSLQRVLGALLIVAMAAFSVASFGWLLGIALALLVALEHGAVARLKFIRGATTRWYTKCEPRLLGAISSYPFVVKYIRIFTPETPELQLHSRDELAHIVEQSHGVLGKDEKALLINSLSFANKPVREVMTPRSMIDSINKVELLGPLVLDDLHKKGHSRFPVIETDVDHVVGMLHLRDVLMVDGSKKHTPKVETVMEKRVFYIHEDQALEHALTAFIKTHHHLFVVVNGYRETVGLLSLEDVIEALLGRKIVDEFDAHEDLRAVAKRNPRGNNVSDSSRDI